jgi:4-hydroxybenzoate polyprenyltransferase
VFDLLISLRPKQWAKNVLVFAGVIFGGQLLDRASVVAAAGAFVVFCLLSSAVYLVNDIIDRDADRRHPSKGRRPIAAGTLGVPVASGAAAVLLAAGMSVAFGLDRTFAEIASLYVLLMALYVGVLKHVVLLDVLVISAGFILRAWAGAAVVHVPVSRWLLTLTLLLAMFLSLSKRRSELLMLADDASAHRPALLGYSTALLNALIAVITAATLVAYALYTVSPETVARFSTRRLLLTIPFPAFGIARYLYLVYRGAGGSDPSEHLLSDRPLLACVAMWAAAVVIVIYYR